jgi:hypothetical protein
VFVLGCAGSGPVAGGAAGRVQLTDGGLIGRLVISR